jgi:small conductance mechanosensitive channel
MDEITVKLNITRITTQVALFLPVLVTSIIIFLFFWLAAYMLQRFIQKLGRKSKVSAELLELARRVAKAATLTIGAVTALGTLGIDVSALVAGLGLTGFALSFALKDAISNLMAGVLILFYRTLKVNDNIVVAGFEGVVTDVDLRYTTLQSEENRILIPNSTLFTNPVKITGNQESENKDPA